MKTEKLIPLERSKKVRDGHIVTLRKGKFIRCGSRMKPFGVWQDAYKILIITGRTDKGQVWEEIQLPAGVVTIGKVRGVQII